MKLRFTATAVANTLQHHKTSSPVLRSPPLHKNKVAPQTCSAGSFRLMADRTSAVRKSLATLKVACPSSCSGYTGPDLEPWTRWR